MGSMRQNNWFSSNLRVAAALVERGYDVRLVLGDGPHDPKRAKEDSTEPVNDRAVVYLRAAMVNRFVRVCSSRVR